MGNLSVGDAFDALVGALDSAMVLVTAAHGDHLAGCLVGFHTQVSIAPRLYEVRISKANHTYGVARSASHVAVHVLGDDDVELAAWFGKETGDRVDKFGPWAWTPGPGGTPLLEGCASRMVLARHSLVDDGSDHLGWIGRPVQVDGTGSPQGPPLRLHQVEDLEPGHPESG